MKLTTSGLLVSLVIAPATSCLSPAHTGDTRRPNLPRSPGIGDFFIRFSRKDIPVNPGDRFQNGSLLPHGLGTDDRDLASILGAQEVSSALYGITNAFDSTSLLTLPYTTHDGNTVFGVSVPGNTTSPQVFLLGGVHARERGGPDALVYFLADLLNAREANAGLSYGKAIYSAEQVEKALEPGIVVVPLANPDGVAYDQNTDSCWRKNRNPAGSVDLNRNFDFLWDYKKALSSKASLWAAASDDPESDIFHGTEPNSEPETKNVISVFDDFSDISWFLDVHSFGGDVLYSWGDDNTQTTDRSQNFENATYDGLRGIIGEDPPDAQYREYMSSTRYASQADAAKRMVTAMQKAGYTLYRAMESAQLYPATGTTTDYAMSRSFVQGNSSIQGLLIEFGEESTAHSCQFYPDNEHYHQSLREVAAGIMELLLFVADHTKVDE